MLKELAKIFGSAERVKLMRFFLAHPDFQIETESLIKTLKIQKKNLKKEIKNLVSIEMLTELILEEEVETKRGKKIVKSPGLELNKNYVYADSLASVLLDFRFTDKQEILGDLKRYAKIKLLAVGGIFVQNKDAKIDLLLVGDALDKEKIENYIKNLEAEFGTEIKFALFESEEFKYRVTMFDRLIRDFLSSPHEKVLEKISTRP